MKSRKKILLAVIILVCLPSIIIVSMGYYLISINPILARASGSNPLEALRISGKVMINELIQTPVKSFDLQNADLKYNRTVYFPEDKLELTTAEQIIEWSVYYNDQPWVEDEGQLLSEANYSLIDTTIHFVFIECKSSENNPVITITYYSRNSSLLVEKGWNKRISHNSYTLIATESIALEMIRLESDYQLIVKAIIENLNNTIRFEKEGSTISIKTLKGISSLLMCPWMSKKNVVGIIFLLIEACQQV
jgi:hypothetical protein